MRLSKLGTSGRRLLVFLNCTVQVLYIEHAYACLQEKRVSGPRQMTSDEL